MSRVTLESTRPQHVNIVRDGVVLAQCPNNLSMVKGKLHDLYRETSMREERKRDELKRVYEEKVALNKALEHVSALIVTKSAVVK